jgi:thioredoxin reductase
MPVDSDNMFDILVIGGGFAGLATAIGAARNVHTVLVFDSKEYRNERSPHFHQLPTWDGKSPSEFHQAARDEALKNYNTISFKVTKIESVKRTDAGTFEAFDATGAIWKGKSLVLATGVVDVPLDIPGFADYWGVRM